MTYVPSFDEIVELNSAIIGARATVTAPDLLHSALGRPFHTFGGQWLHPSTIGQAAALMKGLIAAHGFVDGNKRTAWITTKTFLRRNGVPVQSPQHSVAANFVEGVALHNFIGEAVPCWLAEHLVAR